MKSRALLCACLCLAIVPLIAHAETKTNAPTKAAKATAAAPAAVDAQSIQEKMMEAARPGPEHEKLGKLAGEWNLTVKSMMDPSKPAEVYKATSVITSLMDGRYVQEQTSGEMGGMPFSGMGLIGYDNVLKKYVNTWIDNMGTGIMRCEGNASAAGDVINWSGQASDPVSGKEAPYRQVMRFVSDDQLVLEMYSAGPDGKEQEMMEITYDRKK